MKEPTVVEKADFSKTSIEELLLGMVSKSAC